MMLHQDLVAKHHEQMSRLTPGEQVGVHFTKMGKLAKHASKLRRRSEEEEEEEESMQK